MRIATGFPDREAIQFRGLRRPGGAARETDYDRTAAKTGGRIVGFDRNRRNPGGRIHQGTQAGRGRFEMTTLCERDSMSVEIAELRKEMNDGFIRIHEKLDAINDRELTQDKQVELRLQALEIAESRRPMPPQQPCKYLIEHTDWHEKQNEAARKSQERSESRIWALIIRFAPIVAALIAGAFGVQYI